MIPLEWAPNLNVGSLWVGIRTAATSLIEMTLQPDVTLTLQLHTVDKTKGPVATTALALCASLVKLNRANLSHYD